MNVDSEIFEGEVIDNGTLGNARGAISLVRVKGS